MQEVDVSIIIPTYNRKEELKKLLRLLKNQIPLNIQSEIIVIDDGSNDSTLKFLQEEQEKGNLTFVVQAHKGPGAARNTGMQRGHGNLFVFIDTDCTPCHHWLENLLQCFEDESVGAVGGPEIPDPDTSLLSRCFQFVMSSPLTTGGLRGGRKRLARYYPRTFNMAISRKAYEKVGGFKEWFHGEDVEMSFRIKKAGFKIAYCQDAKVYHKRPETFLAFFLQTLKMGESRWLLFRTHQKLLEPIYLVPPFLLILFSVLLVLSPLSHLCFNILKIVINSGILYLVIVSCIASFSLKSARAFFLIPVAFICQQTGYGLGFIYGLIRSNSSKLSCNL